MGYFFFFLYNLANSYKFSPPLGPCPYHTPFVLPCTNWSMQMVASFTKDVVKLHDLFFVQHCLNNTPYKHSLHTIRASPMHLRHLLAAFGIWGGLPMPLIFLCYQSATTSQHNLRWNHSKGPSTSMSASFLSFLCIFHKGQVFLCIIFFTRLCMIW